ncbi:MAG: hypothetical protein H8D42_00335 [Candidatus Marinimicrobia bacterium]|nr:hypothetical protein [Candidatus Neomarinimicrobiota bacterium]
MFLPGFKRSVTRQISNPNMYRQVISHTADLKPDGNKSNYLLKLNNGLNSIRSTFINS